MRYKVDFIAENTTDFSKALNELVLDTGKAKIIVSCEWPEGTEEDFGYFALVDAMKKAYASIGGDLADLAWYHDDAREDWFSADARTEADIDVDIDVYDEDEEEE